jgi:hypothetical protein
MNVLFTVVPLHRAMSVRLLGMTYEPSTAAAFDKTWAGFALRSGMVIWDGVMQCLTGLPEGLDVADTLVVGAADGMGAVVRGVVVDVSVGTAPTRVVGAVDGLVAGDTMFMTELKLRIMPTIANTATRTSHPVVRCSALACRGACTVLDR